MLLKYRADLCYSTNDFKMAAALFERVLELLPPLNAMVKREVTDSLARCYSQLGEHRQAKERAEQLVRWSPMSLASLARKIHAWDNVSQVLVVTVDWWVDLAGSLRK